jgi:hypothetical protein
MRLPLTLWSMAAVSLSLLGCGSSSTPPAQICMDLEAYSPTTVTPYSFATDIYPIMSDSVSSYGCSMTLICHGTPPQKIDPQMTKTLSFVDPAATVKAALLMNAVHAPNMKRVAPGSVKDSFMAYKLSGKTALSCVNSMCSASAGIGTAPCGDAMPSLGVLPDADRTKILDWIAQGAAD